MRRWFLRFAVGFFLVAMLAGCNLLGLGRAGAIRVVFREGDGARSAVAAGPVEALYFGELEIVAYHHRPGETIQTGGFASGHGNADWSHYVVVQSGHPDARDVVLFSENALDFDELNNTYRPEISREYLRTVGVFTIDFLEVNLYRNGVIIDSTYYGAHAENNGFDGDHLYRYPELGGISRHHAYTRVNGFSEHDQTHNVLFARSDWFSEPVQVRLDYDGDSRLEVAWSSRPLSSFQREVLESLADGGTNRRFYANLIIVPYGPARSFALGDGETVDVTVRFDFSDAIDFGESRTDLDAIRDVYWGHHTNEDIYLWFRTDENGVPMGLQVTLN